MQEKTLNKGLTQKEELFCRLCACYQSPRFSAASAGYLLPGKAWVKLLARQDIRERICEIETAQNFKGDIKKGLEHLAFGSAADAVRLLTSENPESLNPEELDLFNVAEIKRPKGGGLEIKFFDRLKAFEKLAELDTGGKEEAALPFYTAVMQGAKALESKRYES